MKNQDIDGGWAWVALIAVFCQMMIVGGLAHSTGITYILLVEVFPTDPLLTAMPGSLLISLVCLAGVIGGVIAGMTSCRTAMLIGAILLFSGLTGSAFSTDIMQLIVTYGLIAGVGGGILYTPAIASVGFYFERKRDFASGVALAGVGAGLAVLPPLITLFADLYGWRGVLLMLGGIALHTLPLSALIRPSVLERKPPQRSVSVIVNIEVTGNPSEIDDIIHAEPSMNGTRQSKGDNCFLSKTRDLRSLLRELFLNKPFLLFNGSNFFYGMGYAGVSLYFPSYLKSLGEDYHRIAFLISMGGVSSLVARIMTGMVTQNQIETTYIVYIGSLGLAGIFTSISPVMCQTKAGQVIFVCALGFYSQGNVSLLNSLTVDLLRLKLLPVGFGIIMLTMGAGFLLGPIFTGSVINIFSSYSSGLISTGGVLLLSSGFGLSMAALRPIRHHPEDMDLPRTVSQTLNAECISLREEASMDRGEHSTR